MNMKLQSSFIDLLCSFVWFTEHASDQVLCKLQTVERDLKSEMKLHPLRPPLPFCAGIYATDDIS